VCDQWLVTCEWQFVMLCQLVDRLTCTESGPMAYVRVFYYEGIWPWRSGLVIATLLLDRLVGGHSAIGVCPLVTMGLLVCVCDAQRCYP
jgi:hypothetical protein